MKYSKFFTFGIICPECLGDGSIIAYSHKLGMHPGFLCAKEITCPECNGQGYITCNSIQVLVAKFIFNFHYDN